MKKRNLLLVSAIAVSAVAMTACTDETEKKPSLQERFTEGFLDLYGTSSLEATVIKKTDIKVEELVKLGQHQTEAKALKDAIDEVKASIVTNEDYVEIVLPINNVDVPILIDSKQDKVYMGIDWVMDAMHAIPKETWTTEGKDTADELMEIASDLNSTKKGRFVDIDMLLEEEVLEKTDILNLFKGDKLGFGKPTTKETKAVEAFLQSLDSTSFVENKEGSITLKMDGKQLDTFMELTNLIQVTSREELDKLTNEEKLSGGHISEVKELHITTSYQSDRVNEVSLNTTSIMGSGFTVAQEVIYQDINIHAKEKETYDLNTIDVLEEEETSLFAEQLTIFLMVSTLSAMEKAGEKIYR